VRVCVGARGGGWAGTGNCRNLNNEVVHDK
jgi:hypothetical protein